MLGSGFLYSEVDLQLMVHESREEVGAEVKCNRGLATHNIADSSLLNTLVLL